MAETVTVNDVLDGHVVLDIECLDRIYLNDSLWKSCDELRGGMDASAHVSAGRS